MDQVPGGNPTGHAPGGSAPTPRGKMGAKPVAIVIAVVAVAALAYYYRVVLTSPAAPVGDASRANANAAGPSASPAPVVTPVTKEERQNIGSVSVLVQPGMLVRENEALRALFSSNGVELFAVRSIGNVNFDQISAKVQKGEMTMADALKNYWRLDVLEIGNPDQQDVAAWIEGHWPPYEASNISVNKTTAKVDRAQATVHAVTHADLSMLQTIYFLQPAAKGNMVIISSFQGTSRPFTQEIDGLLQSITLN